MVDDHVGGDVTWGHGVEANSDTRHGFAWNERRLWTLNNRRQWAVHRDTGQCAITRVLDHVGVLNLPAKRKRTTRG